MTIQNFIPEVWDATILQAMYESHIFAQPLIVNRNYEGEIRSQGDTVHITGIEPVKVGDYNRYQDIEFDEIDLNTRTMYIDQAKYFGIRIDDIDKWQAMAATMPSALLEAGYSMSRAVDLYVAKTMVSYVQKFAPNNIEGFAFTAGDPTTNGQAVRTAFVSLRTQLKRNNVPEGGRWAIVAPEVYAILLEDPHFVDAYQRGTNSIVEGNGVVGSMYGFTILESNNAPMAADGSYQILAGNNTAVSYAEALTQTEAVRFEKSFGDGIKGLHVYGAKGIRPEGLCMFEITGMDAPSEPVTFRDGDAVDDQLNASRFPRTLTGAAGEKPGDDEVDVDPADGVSDKTPQSLAVAPRTTSVAVSGTKAVTATLTYSDGSTEDVTSSATWTSSKESVATVDAGTVTGVAAGSTNVSATVDGADSVSATARVTVTA